MSDHVVIVTSPDDFLPDSFRFMLVDLNDDQTQLVSSALLKLNKVGNIVVYSYKSSDPIEWLLDKRVKSDFVIFNAESNNDILIGYLTAQKNSYYFGTLKTLAQANRSAIYSVEDVLNLITVRMENNETI
jgi:hypothetical protein